jgi:hypothetical protein
MKKKIVKYYYYDEESILLVNHKGKIRRLYTPFKVLCMETIDNLRCGVWVYVDAVRNSDKDELIYLIQGKEYLHFNFCIQIGF